MSTYAIGDVQGCFDEFQQLLSKINFNSEKDVLWFTGDLVNRGPKSLEVLRYVRQLGDRHYIVLGNHDLHLIALAYGFGKLYADDTLAPILQAEDSKDLIEWLRQMPLLHYDKSNGYVMAHAGLAPAWDLNKAINLAKEVETVLHGDNPEFLLQSMYGNEPDNWDDELEGIERLRCIINYFTRVRLCFADGRLDFAYKGELVNKPKDLMPWFDVPGRANVDAKIIFGHWAALGGETGSESRVYALDTGCVWGNCLTAMRLEDEVRFSVQCNRGRGPNSDGPG